MKTGRNDPCPCGSGQKYKKCCLEKDSQPLPFNNNPAAAPVLDFKPKESRLENTPQPEQPPDHLIAPGEIGDYGEPHPDTEFFKNHQEGSSHYPIFGLILKTPELEESTVLLTKRSTKRWQAEEQKIKKTKNVDQLIEMMKKGIDNLNARVFIDHMLEHKDEALPKILTALQAKNSGEFVELAVRILHDSKADLTNQLIELIKQPVTSAYTLSMLCLLLGFIGSEPAVKPLWDCYHFFKERYPEENYIEGTYIALFELCADKSQFEDEDEEEFDDDNSEELAIDSYNLDEATFTTLTELIELGDRQEAIKLLRGRAGIAQIEAEAAIDELAEEIFDDEDDESYEDFLEAPELAAARNARVAAILGSEDLQVTEEHLQRYLAYLKAEIKFPCNLTGNKDFGWEMPYMVKNADQAEYQRIVQTRASFIDDFELASFIDEVDKEKGILVVVIRTEDQRKFTLPLTNLEEIDEDAPNYQLIDDYSLWFEENIQTEVDQEQ